MTPGYDTQARYLTQHVSALEAELKGRKPFDRWTRDTMHRKPKLVVAAEIRKLEEAVRTNTPLIAPGTRRCPPARAAARQCSTFRP